MNSIPSTPVKVYSVILLFLYSFPFAFSQAPGGGSNSESAAESSVTTSSSKKAAVLPEVVESNPIISIVRSGLPLQDVIKVTTKLSKADFLSVTRSGSGADLKNVATSVSNGSADLEVVAEITKKSTKVASSEALNKSEGVKDLQSDNFKKLPKEYRNKLIDSLKDPVNALDFDKDSATSRADTIVEIVQTFEVPTGSTKVNIKEVSKLLDSVTNVVGKSKEQLQDIDLENVKGRATTVKEVIVTFDGDASAAQALIDATTNIEGKTKEQLQELDLENVKARASTVKEVIVTFDGDASAAQALIDATTNIEGKTKEQLQELDLENVKARASTVKEVINTFGGDASAAQALIDATSDVNTNIDTEDIKARATVFKDVIDTGYSGEEIEQIKASILSADSSADTDIVSIDEIIGQFEEKKEQADTYGTTDFDDLANNEDYQNEIKTNFLDSLTSNGISNDIANEAFDNKDDLTPSLTKLSDALNYGFSVSELSEESSFDYNYYSAAYKAGPDGGRLSREQADDSRSLGYSISQLPILTSLVTNQENDGSYTVSSLVGKNLDLIHAALNFEDAAFDQEEALFLGGQNTYNESDLQNIHNLKEIGFSLTEISKHSESDFDFYTAVYASKTANGNILSQDQAIAANSLGYAVNDLVSLTALVTSNANVLNVENLSGLDLTAISILVNGGIEATAALDRATGLIDIAGFSNEDLPQEYSTFLSEALKDPTKSINQDSAISRAETIKHITSIFGTNTIEVQSLLDASTNLGQSIENLNLINRATAVKEVVDIFGDDTSAVSSLLETTLDLDNSVDTEKVIARAPIIKALIDAGLSGAEIDEIKSDILDLDSTQSTEDLTTLIDEKIAQAEKYGSLNFDDFADSEAYLNDNKDYFVNSLQGSGISLEQANEAFDAKDYLTPSLTKLSDALNYGFSVTELADEPSFDYDYYAAAYSAGYDDVRLSKDQAIDSKGLGYSISQLPNLTLLVTSQDNDGSYTVSSLAGKNLDLILAALNLQDTDFDQSEALVLGGQDTFGESDLANIHNLKEIGFTVVEISEHSLSDFEFYTAVYSSETSTGERLSKEQAIDSKSLGYSISQLPNLTLLVTSQENDDSYTVSSLAGKNLDLILAALNLQDTGFDQSEALVLGGQDTFGESDLANLSKIKESSTAWVLKNSELDGDTLRFEDSTIESLERISLSDILEYTTPDQIEMMNSYDDQGVTYALFKTLENFHDKQDIDLNLEKLGQLVSSVLVDRNSIASLPSYNADSILSLGIVDELAYFLARYNILGQNGSELLAFIENGNPITKENYLSGYIGYLSTYTGSRTFGEDFDTSVADIPLDNVSLRPAANIDLSGSHDVSDNLPRAPLTNNNVESDDIKIMVIGAAKDLTISDHLTIHNDNQVEDHALVLAAADDLHLRSSSNPDDYSDPDPINIEYTGSNLALASQDTMLLINANIKTGGNLAIGTLNELHIGTSDAHHSVINIGTGGNTPSPDNLYLYANELISIKGLDIEGQVSKVYMEAQTLALRNVSFPLDSRIMLRSKTGDLNFNNTPISGYTNLYQTTHASIRGGAYLEKSDFSGTPGSYNSIAKHPNGDPYISVRSQGAN